MSRTGWGGFGLVMDIDVAEDSTFVSNKIKFPLKIEHLKGDIPRSRATQE